MNLDLARAGLQKPARVVFRAGHEAARAAAEMIWPPVCMACGRRPAAGFCDPCLLETVSGIGPTCGRCGRHLRVPGAACRDCRTAAFAFSKARGVARYRGLLRALVRRFKLGGEPHLAAPLGGLLADLAERECPSPDLVVPVPLARWKLLVRGYNQAELLAEQVARRLRRPHLPRVLRRLRATGKQAFLTRESRIANSAGLFAPARPVFGPAPDLSGRSVLLVDDVVTTGATASACAAALRRLGAKDVVVLAVGR